MSRNHLSNYVVVHYTLKPSESSFDESYATAKEAMHHMHDFEAADDGIGYSEITCKAAGKKGRRDWHRKKIRWTRILAPAPALKDGGELDTPTQLGFLLPVASQAAEHGLPQEVVQ
jgi:hypothetical protein